MAAPLPWIDARANARGFFYPRLRLSTYSEAMGKPDQQAGVAEALERIEETILPGISMMLDTLLDAAALARPGFDADVFAAELRTIALQLDELTRQVESLSPGAGIDPQEYRSASAA